MKIQNQIIKMVTVEFDTATEQESITRFYEELKSKEFNFDASGNKDSLTFVIAGFGDCSKGESDDINPIIDEINKLEKI